MTEKKTTPSKPADDFIRIQDLWGIFMPRWHWFALSLFVTLATAALYLLGTPNIYTRTAAILVKDNSKSSSSTSAMNDFSDLGIFKSNTNINNELLTLKIAHADDRGGTAVGIKRDLYCPQRTERCGIIQKFAFSSHLSPLG